MLYWEHGRLNQTQETADRLINGGTVIQNQREEQVNRAHRDWTDSWTEARTEPTRGWGAGGEIGGEAQLRWNEEEGKKKKKKQNKRKADRLEEKSAGNGAGLARLMQGRCGGKGRQGNRAKHRKHSKGGQRLQETVLGGFFCFFSSFCFTTVGQLSTWHRD